MQKRLETDTSLSQFVGQFVPLKVISSGEQWQQWASKYKKEGSGIPIIYVVRADGEQLYGKSGALTGGALPQMLAAASQQSGRVLSESESLLLEKCNEAAEQALSENLYLEAAEALAPAAKIGSLGDLQSFAEPAMKSDELSKTILEHALSELKEVEGKLEDPETVFEGVVELVQAREAYLIFAKAKEAIGVLLKQVSRDKAQRALLKPAKVLVKARRDARLPKASDKKRAEKGFGLILKRYGDSPAAAIARKELTGLNPASELLAVHTQETATSIDAEELGYGQEQVRTWSDSSGKFSVEAKLIEVTEQYVRLVKESGKEIKVPLKKLDSAARAYLESRQ